VIFKGDETMSEEWLKCRVFKGMFSDERAVVFRLKSGEDYSAFVSESKVIGNINEEGKLRVKVFRNNGSILVQIPTDQPEVMAVQGQDLITA
jgi:hypothetical protein